MSRVTATLPQDVAVLWVDHQGSDWLGIYVDGDRVYEGHPPDVDDAFQLLGISDTGRTFPSDRLARPGLRGLPLRLPTRIERSIP